MEDEHPPTISSSCASLERCTSNEEYLQGFSETTLSFSSHGGMNVTGLRMVDFSNQTIKGFLKAWQGRDSDESSGTGHSRLITVSSLVNLFGFLHYSFNYGRKGGYGVKPLLWFRSLCWYLSLPCPTLGLRCCPYHERERERERIYLPSQIITQKKQKSKQHKIQWQAAREA